MLKTVFLLLFIASGGAVSHPKIKRYLKKYKLLRRAAVVMATISAIYLVAEIFIDFDGYAKRLYQRITIGPYLDRNFSIAECDHGLTISCIKYGGLYGDTSALFKIRDCQRLKLLSSADPSLNWVSLWITNVYSFTPGGGGPGGGLVDDVLKVGGWGDWYFSLIKFEIPLKTELSFAGLLLFVRDDEQETVPLYIDRIIERWKWDFSQHIWWKDRPGGFPVVSEALPPPQKTHWYVIEITKLYNQWSSGVIGNFGMQIRPATNYGSIITFVNNMAQDRGKIPQLLLCEKM
jgi:hypothetical protein